MSTPQAKWAAPAVLLVVLQSSCGVPGIRPFSDATGDMAVQLRSGFEKTQATMKLAADRRKDGADCNGPDSEKSFDCLSRKLDEAWKPTENAIDAVVKYADSLTALAASGKRNQQAIAGLCDTVGGLAASLFPGAEKAAGIGKEVFVLIAGMRTERDLRKAVLQAREAVAKMAPVLEKNFANLAGIYRSAADVWVADVQAESKTLRDYYRLRADEEADLQSRLLLIGEYQHAVDQVKRLAAMARSEKDEEQARKLEQDLPRVRSDKLAALVRTDADFKAPEPGANPDDAVEARRRQLTVLLDVRSAHLASLTPRYRQATVDLDTVLETRQMGARVLAKAGQLIGAWQAAHQALYADGENPRGKPAVAALTSANKEMYALIK